MMGNFLHHSVTYNMCHLSKFKSHMLCQSWIWGKDNLRFLRTWPYHLNWLTQRHPPIPPRVSLSLSLQAWSTNMLLVMCIFCKFMSANVLSRVHTEGMILVSNFLYFLFLWIPWTSAWRQWLRLSYLL